MHFLPFRFLLAIINPSLPTGFKSLGIIGEPILAINNVPLVTILVVGIFLLSKPFNPFVNSFLIELIISELPAIETLVINWLYCAKTTLLVIAS